MDYLLLRSNKKSGPYSFEQLIKMGLKPYDLIWIEGKSAAWRYPSELPELKDFAPAIEEQPYDRFYKKAPEEKHFFESLADAKPAAKPTPEPQKPEIKYYEPVIQQQPVIQKTLEPGITFEEKHYEVPVQENKPFTKPVEINFPETPVAEQKQYDIPVEKKQEIHLPADNNSNFIPGEKKPGKVFVSMPVKASVPYRQEPKIPIPVTPPVSESLIEKYAGKKQVIEEKDLEEKAELKEEYSQSLDEIKKMYTQTYLQRKQKASRKQAFSKFFQVAGIAACAIGVAALVYFVFLEDKKAGNSTNNLAMVPQTVQENNLPENSSSADPVEKNEKKDLRKTAKDENKIVPENNIPPATEDEREAEELLKQMDEIVIPDTETGTEETIENNPGGRSNTDPATGQRNKTSRTTSGENRLPVETDEKVNIRSVAVINRFVSVKANEYKRKAFGGIQDLQVTVSNNSKFILDKVVVELQYYKPSEEPLKTEKIEMNDIAPNGTMTVKIPDSQRGIKVTCKIIDVESSQFDKHLAGM